MNYLPYVLMAPLVGVVSIGLITALIIDALTREKSDWIELGKATLITVIVFGMISSFTLGLGLLFL